MNNGGGKDWNRPWTSEEIAERAENWSLAGDAALLNTLKAFADNLLIKTEVISERMDTLLNNLSEASLKLDLAQNEFQILKHTQFIESRVYEDDETLDSSTIDQKEEEKPISEEEQDKQIIESIKAGMVIINDYYDKVEISVSDSEEEETERSYTLKPKDVYAHRPLPPVIGTPDWYKKWHLEDVSSESESEKMSEIYSESDSEDNIPKDLMKESETSSELDFSNHVSENRSVANSFNNPVRKPDLISSSGEESDEPQSLPVKTPLSSQSFAEQLAAKLGNVISQQEEVSPEVNKKVIQPLRTDTFAGDLFRDEPPPLDSLENDSLEKDNNSGLFSGGKGLFDDSVDELFWQHQNTPSEQKKKSRLFEDEGNDEALPPPTRNTQKSSLPKSSQVSKGLFDSEESSDDDIFSTGKKKTSQPSFLQPSKPVAPLFDDEPPQLEEKQPAPEEPKIKKPVGAVKIFDSPDLFGDQKITDILKKSKKPVIVKNEPTDSPVETKSTIDTSKINKSVSQRKNLFDEDDEDDNEIIPRIKSDSKSKTKKLDLFGDEDSQDIVKSESVQVISEKDQTSKDLLDGNTVEKLSKPKKISLFDDDDIKENKKSKKISLFDDDDDLFKDDIFSDITSKKESIKFFSDFDSTTDLFSKKHKDGINESTEPKSETDLLQNEKQSDGDINFKTEEDTIENKKEVNNDTISEDLDSSFALEPDNAFRKLLQEKKMKLFSDSSEEETTSDKDSNKINASAINFLESEKENTERSLESANIKHEYKEEEPKEIANRPPVLEVKKFGGLFSDSEEEDDGIFSVKTTEKLTSTMENKSGDLGKSNILTPDNSGKIVNVSQEEILVIEKTDSSPVTEVKKYDLQENSNNMENASITERAMGEDIDIQRDCPDPLNKRDRPDINIFASSPPPDDGDDWDTKSDSLPDDDFLSYRTDQNSELSNVFDNEPPLLVANDSSGIVKDYTGTRVETDYFSFYPDASSSRRHSSDIFNEQQSQDNFLVTNTKSDFTKPPSNLDTIPETTKTNVELTPSGDIRDFDTTISISQEVPSKGHEVNVTTESNQDLPSNTPFDENADDIDDGKHTEVNQATETSMKNKISMISELLKNKPIRTPQNYAKEISEKSDRSKQESPENVEVLHCVTKTRAKIPIKRRPSTRRARQEAIRKSVVDDELKDSEAEQYPEKSREDIPEKQIGSHNNSEATDLTNDEQELFQSTSIEKIETSDTIENPSQNYSASTAAPDLEEKNTNEKKAVLFSDSFSDDDGLFTVTSKKSNVPKTKDALFDSDRDSDSDLFGTVKSSGAKPKKTESEKVISPQPKKSLFEDSSSDEDLFSGAKKQVKHEPAKPITFKTSKLATTKKLENIKLDDDPLTKLLK